MLQREAGIDTGYTPPIAAGIRPMYLRARDRGYSRGYGWHAEVRKILVIQVVSASYATPAGGATPTAAHDWSDPLSWHLNVRFGGVACQNRE